jgi:hypothetical protein
VLIDVTLLIPAIMDEGPKTVGEQSCQRLPVVIYLKNSCGQAEVIGSAWHLAPGVVQMEALFTVEALNVLQIFV